MSTYWASATLQIAVFATLGLALGVVARDRFRPRYLVLAVAVVLLRRILTRIGHRVLDLGDLIPALTWDWSARLIALAGTIGILLLLRDIRLRDAGLTLRHEPGSLRSGIAVAVALVAIQIGIQAIVWPGNTWTVEELAYQATMPGLEEDPFYWGLLLLLLDRAYGTPWRIGAVRVGWGAVLAVTLFGLVHGLGWRTTGLRLDPFAIARTMGFGAGYLWIRARTGSLALSAAAHNLGNTLRLFT